MSENVKSTRIVLELLVFSLFDGKSWVAPLSMQWRHEGLELAFGGGGGGGGAH